MNDCCILCSQTCTVFCLLPNDVACTGLSVDLGWFVAASSKATQMYFLVSSPSSQIKKTSCCCCFEANRTPSGTEMVTGEQTSLFCIVLSTEYGSLATVGQLCMEQGIKSS